MATFEKLDDELLEDVVGGVGDYYQIDTHSSSNAVIRASAALNSRPLRSLKNGVTVRVVDNEDGVYNFKDGRTWYKIDYPVEGWVVGRSVGLPERKG